MATREENIKKINEELEKLDDEKLEEIAGGLRRRYYAVETKIETLDDEPNLKARIRFPR